MEHQLETVPDATTGSISVRFLAKVPGPEMRLGEAKMVFRYEDSFSPKNELEGYERLILDAMFARQIAVHKRQPGGALMGDLYPTIRKPSSRRAVRARIVGPAVHRQADRTSPLVLTGGERTWH